MTMDERIEPAVRFVPRVPTWQVSRPQLVERVEHGLTDGLVIVRAVAGGGKTSLLSEWGRTTSRSGSWFTVDETVVGRFALWDQVVRSAGGDRAAAAAAAVEAANGLQLRSALQDAFGERPHVLVLDEADGLSDPDIFDDIAWLVRHTSCAVILSTRAVLPLENPAQVARLGPVVIGPESMAFTAEETTAVLEALADSPDLVHAAYNQLRGWPLGTRALQLELEHRGPNGSLDESLLNVATMLATDHPSLPDALKDASIMQFAVRVSLPEWITLELAETLAGTSEASLMMDELEANGLGSWSDAREGRIFRLQPFLRTSLMRSFNALPQAERTGIRRSYAVWAAAVGLPVIAGREAVEIGDWDLLSDVTKRHFRRVMRLHHSEWVVLLRAVPLERMLRLPALASVYVQLLNAVSAPMHRIRALSSLLLDSIAPIRERGSTLDRIWRNSALLAVERITGRYTAAGATAERLNSLIERLNHEEYASLEELLPTLYIHIATTRLYNGDLPGATAVLEDALRAQIDAPWSRLHALSVLAMAAALDGDMRRASTLTRDIESTIDIPGWRGTYSAAGFHIARGLLAVEAFDPRRAVEEMDQLERHFATIEHWPLILRVRALAAMLDGSSAAAAERLPLDIRDRARRSQTSAAMRALLVSTRADLLLAAGETSRADGVLANGGDRGSLNVMAAAARSALVGGNDARALALSNAILTGTPVAPVTTASGLLVQAIANARLGRRDPADQAARRAVIVLNESGLRLPLALVPRDDLIGLVADAQLTFPLSDVPHLIADAAPTIRLTRRERAVLDQLVAHSSVRALAQSLFVSPNTVKSQLRSLYRKLGVSTRDEALQVARAMALMSEYDPTHEV